MLVDISAIVLSDIPAGGSSLEAAYRLGYGFDRANSQIVNARNNADETSFEVMLHYAVARIPVAQPGQAPFAVPHNVPDARSVSMRFLYSFSALPEPMTPRMADPRVGYFFETRWDFRSDTAPTPRTHFIKRWRLEKKDETAALSEPKQPIVYWIDKNVPERYRQAVSEGILMWNSAFERIGYKDAIVVKRQTDTDDFDTADRHHASVRWFIGTDTVLAVGPSNTDPRTGEILDADIIVADNWSRTSRREVSRDMPTRSALLMPHAIDHGHDDAGEECDFGEEEAAYMSDTLDTLIARGDITPDSPEAEAYVQDTIRITVAHEVGHTLGLSHNFLGTRAYTPAQLRDADFVAKNGTSASVMDYVPPNINLSGEKPAGYLQKVLGPYDIWAIEYGYKSLPAGDEAHALKQIAERGQNDPLLAYGNDIDAGGEGLSAGIDPDTNRFDLSSDTRAWFTRRLQFAQEQWDALAKRPPSDDPYYGQARLSVDRSISLLTNSAQTLAKKIGGIRIIRQTSPAARASFLPIPESEQRDALNTLTHSLFATESFHIDPTLLQRLPLDHLDRFDGTYSGSTAQEPNLQLVSRVLAAQTSVLDQLLSDRTTIRLLESEMLRTRSNGSLPLSELLGTLQNVIWQELDGGKDINLLRRNLQRAWLSRIAVIVTAARPSAPDVRSLARSDAAALRARLQQALQRNGSHYSAETRAHLQDSLATLDEALSAKMIRPPSIGRHAPSSGIIEYMKPTALEVTLTPLDNQRLANLCGALDENLRQIEASFDVAIARRGEHFKLRGENPQMQRAAQALRRFYEQANEPLEVAKIQLGVIEQNNLDQGVQPGTGLLTRKGDLHGRTPRQVEYIRNIQAHDITFGIGPAGTGKTYLAVACAVDASSASKSSASSSRARPWRPASAWASCLAICRRRLIPTCAPSTMPCMSSWVLTASQKCSSASASKLHRWPSCAGAPSAMHSSFSTKRRTPRRSK